ncbi:MAG: radical SAM protein [Candidatus Hodarchaeota archaeon]
MPEYKLQCAVWEITLGCNLKCSHCGSSAGVPRNTELSKEECYSLVEALAGLDCESVALMGGEPFLRNDWLSIAWCVKNLNMGLNIVSNGILIPKHLDDLGRLEPDVVGLSLDGMETNHDKIRGKKGLFRRVINSIVKLRQIGIQVTVITTISTINFADLQPMKDLLQSLGVNWQIQVAAPMGNFCGDLAIDLKQFYNTAVFLEKTYQKSFFYEFPVVGGHCFGYHSSVFPSTSNWKGCTAGINSIGITSNGNIVGCLAMGNDRFIEGNVREKPIQDIWNDPNAFKYNRSFLKKDLGDICAQCEFGMECKGGCNAMSFAFTGKLHSDPYCYRRFEMKYLKSPNGKI